MIDIDYYWLISIIGLSINCVWGSSVSVRLFKVLKKGRDQL